MAIPFNTPTLAQMGTPAGAARLAAFTPAQRAAILTEIGPLLQPSDRAKLEAYIAAAGGTS